MFDAYLDESGTHDNKVLIVAGYVADVGKWARFSVEWNGILAANNLRWFHMKEFMNGKSRAFRHLSSRQKRSLLTELILLIKSTVAFGVVTCAKPYEYEQVTTQKFRSLHLSAYSFCVSACVAVAISRLRKMPVLDERLGVFLEHKQNNTQVLENLKDFKRQTDPLPRGANDIHGSLLPPFRDQHGDIDPYRERGIKISSTGEGGKDSMPPLQAADIFAYCVHSQASGGRKEQFCTNVLIEIADSVPSYAMLCTPEVVSDVVKRTLSGQEEMGRKARAAQSVLRDLRAAGLDANLIPYTGVEIVGPRRKIEKFLAKRESSGS